MIPNCLQIVLHLPDRGLVVVVQTFHLFGEHQLPNFFSESLAGLILLENCDEVLFCDCVLTLLMTKSDRQKLLVDIQAQHSKWFYYLVERHFAHRMLVNHGKEFFCENHIVNVVDDAPIAACMTSHPLLEISESHKLLLGLSKQFLELLYGHECVQILRTDLNFVCDSFFTRRLLHVHSI